MKYFTATALALLIGFIGSNSQAKNAPLSTKACTVVFPNNEIAQFSCLRDAANYKESGATDFETADVICGEYYSITKASGVAKQKACEEAVLGHFVNPIQTACKSVQDNSVDACINQAKRNALAQNENQPQSDLSVAVIYVCAAFDGNKVNRTNAEIAACDNSVASSRQ